MGAVAVRHDPASAGLVRRILARELSAHGLPRDTVEDILLVASELVGNAVTHTDSGDAGELDIGWQLEADGAVLLWVCDTSRTVPERRVVGVEATSGRGLAIVAAVAADWGVEPLPTGKKVWARITVPA